MSYNLFQRVKGMIAGSSSGQDAPRSSPEGLGARQHWRGGFHRASHPWVQAVALGRWEPSWRWSALCRPLCAELGGLARRCLEAVSQSCAPGTLSMQPLG